MKQNHDGYTPTNTVDTSNPPRQSKPEMRSAEDILNEIALKHGHRDWELARYRLGENHLHVLIIEAMEEYANQFKATVKQQQ